MTERIDHVAEARRIVEAFHAPSPEGAQMIAEAQVHATLALVEQQRIANILTLVGDEDPETVNDNLLEVGADPAAVRADIVAALGWS